jgi:beta,beta-carotene 9',10'-dioxygenase
LFRHRWGGDAPGADDSQLTAVPPSELRRYHVSLAGGPASYDRISQESIELPRIDYRRNGRDYRYVYGAGMSSDDFMDRLVKIDVGSGSTSVWSEPGCYPGEPVFVARPGSHGEDDGVLLSVVLDGGSGRSFLLVLAAGDLSEIARAEVPHHIPFGFHGQYLR